MGANTLFVLLLFAGPLALYAFLIGMITTGVATWPVAILRPLLLTLLITPGIAAGHGIGFAPMAIMLFHGLTTENRGMMLSQNLTIWLVVALLAFLFECGLAAWRRRKQPRALRSDGAASAQALRQLSGEE